MTKKQHIAIRTAIALLLTLSTGTAQAQKFFNLTADEVKIDSMLPHFTYSQPLGSHYQDSVYSIHIKYPEFINMSADDVKRYQELSGETLPKLPKIDQYIAVNRKQGFLEAVFCPLVYRDGQYKILVSFMLEVKATPRKASSRRKATATSDTEPSERYARQSVLATGKWAKIRVENTGVHQITDELVRQAGFSDPSKVKVFGYGGNLQNETLNASDLIEYDDLKEVPTCTTAGKRLFYARGPVSWESRTTTVRTRNPYSDYGYYFLTESNEEPLRVDSATFVGSFYPSNDDYHALHEVDNYAWYHGGRNLYESKPINIGSTETFTIDAPTNIHAAQVAVITTAGTNSTASITLNDEPFRDISINWSNSPYSTDQYDAAKTNTASVSYVEGIKPTNEVKITTKSGGPLRLDYISMKFFEPRPEPQLTTDRFPVPVYVHHITNQNHHADTPVDMVIIIPTSQKLLKQAQRLATYHEQHDGIRTRIVPADELYNEFSSGTPDANAYRKYLKMLYDRAETDDDMPKYLLLFGDCAWDNRMNTNDWNSSNVDDYLLCYESENSFSEVYCYIDDGWFCLLDDGEGSNPQSRDKLDMAVGRFPVTTEAEAKILVDKTINYMNNQNAGSWQNTIMFMGDDGNNNLHMRDINEIADTIAKNHPGYLIKKVMWDAYKREVSSTGASYPEVTILIKQQQTAGALIMNYAGHGRADQISHEAVLKLTDFEDFRNTNLPLWITASCDIMPFDGTEPTIGETALLNSKGGAIAFYGTTRTVYADRNKNINMAFMRHILTYKDGKPITLGEAQRIAKNELIDTGADRTTNKLQYSLLGDPALRLNIPTANIIIDEINGISTTEGSSLPALKAGSIASIKGHVEDLNEFNGVVTVTVRDSEERITCRMNDTSETESAFTFRDRPKTLFHGSDSIRNGEFVVSFAVPMDINYSDANGLINVYAVNESHTIEANGSCNNFLVGGSELSDNDGIGPSIYCYLNKPSFTNGDKVNSTPYFVAEISDKDGINATGNGIGHDLQLIIDGDMMRTYSLNENFQYDFGTYTKGSTYYNIPELEPGEHTLLFRAWDILNNSSTAQLTFNVVRGLEPTLFSVACTNNPATSSTTFIINHDRSGSVIDVEIDVFDTSGRHLWQHKESGLSASGAYTVDWDLTVDSGARLQTGVYLYRARISSESGTKVSKANKLVIIGNK